MLWQVPVDYGRNVYSVKDSDIMRKSGTGGFLSAVKIITMTAAVFLAASGMSAKDVRRDNDGHVLVKEWKDYREALKDDRPQSQEKILGKLIDKAEASRLSWDFYDASRKYYYAVRSYDWKKAGDVAEALKKRVEDYDSPVVSWNLAYYGLWSVEAPSIEDILGDGRLRHEKNSQFYSRDRYLSGGHIAFPEAVLESLSNDKEYLMWSFFMFSSANAASDVSGKFDTAADALEEYYSGRYPEEAFVEFVRIMHDTSDSLEMKASSLEAFRDKYAGKGIGLYAEEELVRMTFNSLERDGGTSDDYRALRDRCEAFVKAKKAMKSDAALAGECCMYPSGLIDRMDFPMIDAGTVNGSDTLRICLRNLPGVDVRIQDKDSVEVFGTHLENTVGSYYVFDTLEIVMPALNDGRFNAICRSGDVKASFRYDRYTLSAATQMQDKGLAVYLADYDSGKPVGKADISIFYKDSLVRRITDVCLDGFTLVDPGLPEEADGRFMIQCSYTDSLGVLRMSREQSVWQASTWTGAGDGNMLSCMILKDRSAFNPGDTLKFKTILYETMRDSLSGWPKSVYKVWTGDTPVIAELADVSGRTVARDTLHVNDFGSAAGAFPIDGDRVNGRYSLKILHDGRVLGTSFLTVDEFVLPSFTLEFEPSGKIYFPGDTVTVRGRLKSYAGQSLSAAAVTYSVSLWGEPADEGTLDVASDGTFALSFVARDGKNVGSYLYYNVSVKVTDATGESHEFTKGVVINDFHLAVNLENDAEASITLPEDRIPDTEADSADVYTVKAVEGNFAVLSFDLSDAGYTPVQDGKISYAVRYGDRIVCEGDTAPGEKIWVDLSSWPSGVYRVSASACAGGRTRTCVCDLIKADEDDGTLYMPLENFFRVIPSGGDIKVQFGASDGPVWAVVQLFGGRNTCLYSEIVHLDGVSGESGSLRTLEYGFKDNYPDAVQMLVTYFRNARFYTFSHDFDRKSANLELPLSFTRFTDKAWPGEDCVYEIMTLPGAECAVSVFDVTTETIASGRWNRLMPAVSRSYVWSNCVPGEVSGRGRSQWYRPPYEAEAVPFQLVSAAPRFSRNSVSGDMAVEEVADNAVMTKSVAGAAQALPADVAVREDFSEALAFYPFLRADAQGKISFSFKAGDKLSEYYVSLFAHDKSMSNNVLRKTMQVSLPVTVSVMQPAYLYSGDRYVLQVALSNQSEADAEGVLTAYFYDGKDYQDAVPLMVMSRPAGVPVNSSRAESFITDVPYDIDTLGIKVLYRTSSGASDGIFVAVPVSAPVQTLYESHSSLLMSGMSRDSLYRALQSEFVNVSGYGAVSREISIYDMLIDAVPDTVSATSASDAISVARACFSSRLAGALRGDVAGADTAHLDEILLSYQNTGGGFAWLKGGPSSPLVTAVILEYIAAMDRYAAEGTATELAEAASKAVGYLDEYYFSGDRLMGWAGGISLGQYLYVRSLYADEPLAAEPGRKELKAFRGQVKKYLYDRETDAPGYILYKARRANTALNFILSADTDSDIFLETVGLKANRKLESSIDRYMVSLKEYAADHRSGGKYYPNAVMPFRGLLENELYAHSALCRLLSEYADYAGDREAAEIADGIRLWIMVQKETQDWDEDPAYLLALEAVSGGSQELLSAKVLVLTQKYEKPFSEIKAAGNDVSVDVRYFKEDSSVSDSEIEGYREIAEGEALEVGDRILAVYDIWSAENRSFVRFSAPRYAAMRPEDQLSGPYGLHFRPLYRTGLRQFYPYSYREVKADRSIWYMDVLAEEDTRLTETFVVTQAGAFTCPAAEVECMYAPHYRANAEANPCQEVSHE